MFPTTSGPALKAISDRVDQNKTSLDKQSNLGSTPSAFFKTRGQKPL